MASRIKGITVEIGGDTTGLDKALKNVNATIRTTQSSLKDVNKLLKLDPANTELLAQKQKLLKDAIGSTKEKLDALKTAQEQAQQLCICRIQFQQLIDILQRGLGQPDRCIYIFQGFVKTSGIPADLDRDSFNPACHLHTPPVMAEKKHRSQLNDRCLFS